MGYIGNQSAKVVYTNLDKFKGEVADIAALNTIAGMVSGDMYKLIDTNHSYMYDGAQWVDMGDIEGPQGAAGVSVSSVTRTIGDGSEGTTDTYTITYSDTSTSTFEVKNGTAGVVDHITRTVGTGVAGETDTYTAYADAGATQVLGTFDVYNGTNGQAIDHTSKTAGTGAAGTTDTYTVWGDVGEAISMGTFDVYNGLDGSESITSVVAGTNVTVDNTDPAKPIINVGDTLPDQTSNAGKYLTTDGVDTSWSEVDLSSKADVSTTYTKTEVDSALEGKVDDSQVLTNVPSGAVFTDNDTTYSPATPGTNGTDGVDGLLEDSDKYKLNNIEAGATADQTKVDIEGLAINASSLTEDTTHRLVTDTEKSTWSSKQDVLGFTAEDSANKGVANGYASLDASGLVPSTQLPSFVDDVVMAANLTTIEAIEPLEASKIYVAEDTNITYRWSGTGTTMIAIGSDLALGETSSTAYRGDLGKIAYDHSQVAHAPSNADSTAINETSHADVLVDGDFGTAGIMKTDGLGTYSIDSNTYIQTSHSAHNISSGDITNLSNLSGTNSGDEPAVTTTTGGVLTDVQAVKFDGIATGATANDTDANLKNRINHTGTQTASTISDFDTEVGNHIDVSANTTSRHNHTYGIANTNTVQISVVDVADDDYARFTATGLEGRTLTEMVTDMKLSSSDISDISANADQTSANETSHGNITLGTSTITNTALDANLEITGNGTGKANIDGNALTATTATNVTDTSVAQDSTFGTTAGLVKSDGDGTYSVDTNTYLTSETSHSDVVVDGDFTSEGLMYRDVSSGSYSMKTIGTDAGNIIALDGTSRLPAVDGSALTGIAGLPDQVGHSGQYLQTNGTAADWVELSSGGGLSYVIKDVNYTASVGDYILADTSAVGFTVTLPNTPTKGDIVTILDTSGTFGANALTLSSDSTVNGIGSGAKLTHSNTVTVLMYDGTTWKTYLQRNVVGSVASENITGPSVGNEGTEVELVINNYDYTNEYGAAVNGGDVSVAFDRVVWNLPAVDADTTYTLTLTVNGSTEIKYQVLVININVLSDDAISVTDFSINSTNTGWTI